MAGQLIFEDKDASGKVAVRVYREQSSQEAAKFTDFACTVDEGFVVIGGGGSGEISPGALLTASYPGNDRRRWLVSSKDHNVSSPHRVTAYAIAMKINGMTPGDLLANLRFKETTSGNSAHPEAASGVDPGFELISGGFRVNTSGAGNLATASFPELGPEWRARSKDHKISSLATITVFSIALRKTLPRVGTVQRGESSNLSGKSVHPGTQAFLSADFALTGVGAETHTDGPGQLLWSLAPQESVGQTGTNANSKDHQLSSPGKITAFALGIKIV
ncbi:hypothetical protein [Streptomyces sp. NPDC048516]|uniref:hypothetical protein n=1 Tax=Streptomyces sp. NPDC048516 TaxID=3365565 RepID=UPI00370F77C6